MGKVSIERGETLMGIRYWSTWTNIKPPYYTIYAYFGHAPSTGNFYFKRRKGTSYITRTFYQIEAGIREGTFKPFVLDYDKITSYVQGNR